MTSLTSSATSLTFEAAFSAAPSFSIFLSPVTLPTLSFIAPLAWSIFSSKDIITSSYNYII